MKHALIDGEWRYDGGASLPTYFMGACLYVFPNEFRRRRVQLEKWRRQNGRDPAVSMPEAELRSDPAVLATGKIHVLDHVKRHRSDRARDIVALTLDQYSQDEIVELLGERSIRAVEGVLYRWRTQRKTACREVTVAVTGKIVKMMPWSTALIERSSLGTAGARQLRERIPRSRSRSHPLGRRPAP